MFKDYENKEFKGFDAWKSKVRVITEHRSLQEIDYDMLENTFDLKDLYDQGMQPRAAVEAMAKEIFDL